MRHLNLRNEMGSALDSYAYLWIRNGSGACLGQVTGYRIPGPAPCQEVLIANFGAPRRNDWRALAVNGDRSSDWTGHYQSAETALIAHRVAGAPPSF